MPVQIAKWSTLRGVGNSALVRLTVLIPFIGYLVLFNEYVVRYLEIVTALGGDASEQTVKFGISPRLLLIYYGLCAIALGSAIYSILCPNEVKHYGTPAAYIGGDARNIGDFAFEPIEKLLQGSAYRSGYERIRNRYEPGVLSQEQKDQVNNGILHLYFDYLNNSYPVMRLIAAASFGFGFICLSIPSMQVFYKVTKLLFWMTARVLIGT